MAKNSYSIKTRSSLQQESVKDERVIQLTGGARYRRAEIDLANGSIFRFFGTIRMNGKGSEDGLRAIIPRLGQIKPNCKVLIEDRKYEIIDHYSGLVSIGIENCSK